MYKQSIKQSVTMRMKKLTWRAITTVILTLTAIITVWVYASFIKPSAGPHDSDQDFSQNILGTNNADNDFDSSAVTTNKDGSIAERLEYITNRMTTAGQWYSTECADSTTTAKTNCYVDNTAKYVDTNVCSASSNTGYCFMNTATFSAMDGDLAADKILYGVTIFGVTGTAQRTCYDGSTPKTTDWGSGAWLCTGSNQRCYNGSCYECSGFLYGGYCWHSGGTGQSCDTACGSYGGTTSAGCATPDDTDTCTVDKHWYGCSSCNASLMGPGKYSTADWCYYCSDVSCQNCAWSYAGLQRLCVCNF
jgi:hypothetical protein